MKILHVFDFFSPAHGGGTVDLLYRLAIGQSRREHEVSIYTSDFELDRPYINSLSGVDVQPLPSWMNIAGIHVTPGLISRARENLRGFDLIHLHCFRSFHNIVIHHYARKYGIPYVLDAHGSTPRIAAGKKNPMVFFKWLYDIFFGYRTMRDAARLIADTQVGAEEYHKLNTAEKEIALVHPPLDTDEFSVLPVYGTFRRRFNITQKRVVIFLGRINWIKGIDFLVKSFARLDWQTQDLLLVIVGPDDGYQQTIEKLIKDLGISEKVLFTGFLSGKEKLSALVDADVLVQPSIYEQGARVSLEAIMCGTPVIVSKNTGAGEDIQKMDGGDVVEYGDIAGVIEAMWNALNNPAEAQIRTKNAIEYIKANFSLKIQVDKYEAVYRDAIEINMKAKKKKVNSMFRLEAKQ